MAGEQLETKSLMQIAPAPSAAPSRLYLLVIEGDSSRIFDLPADGKITMGRDPDAGLRLQDNAVSRRHSELSITEGRVTLIDLGSHNGTKLNGERVSAPRELRSGDVVTIGASAFVLHAVRGPTEPTLLHSTELRARVLAETARALEYERSLSVVALRIDAAATEREAIALAVRSALRPIDVAAWDDERTVIVLLPETETDAAIATAAVLVEALAPRAVRAGVALYPSDGTDADALLGAVRAASTAAAPGETSRASAAVRRIDLGERSILVADAAMLRLYELIQRLASSHLPVLITGETGTGKEHAAYAVHFWSSRKTKPFVAINCAAIAETLAESELFGHEKGAFSGALSAKTGLLEAAAGGTIFLDEVGELSLPLQAKLLRALENKTITRVGAVQERAVDVRVVAATHKDLREQVAAGRFRSDLFFRLGAATVSLLPLRDRPRDLAVLTRSFLDEATKRLGRAPMRVSAAAMETLSLHAWPGNVRELKNAIDYIAATVRGEELMPWHLPAPIGAAPVRAPDSATALGAPDSRRFPPIAEEIRDLEVRRISEALEASGGNRTRAAALLAMPLRTFVTKLKQYGLGTAPTK